jgi:hypothetical protein
VLFPLIVDNLKSHTPGVEPLAPGVGTIPLLDSGKTEELTVETGDLIEAISNQGDEAHQCTPT